MRTLKDFKLSSKILIGLFVPMVLVCIILGTYMIDRIKTDSLMRIEEKGQTISNLLAKISVIPIITHDYWALEEYVTELLKDKEIVYAVTYSKSEKPLTTTSEKPSRIVPGEIEIFTIPVFHNDNVVGEVEVGISTKRFREELQRDIIFLTFITFV